jgi:hypothetical protein
MNVDEMGYSLLAALCVVEEHLHDGEDDCADECCEEAVDGEAGNKFCGELEHECVDDEEEETEGDDAQGEGDDFEDSAEGHVEESDDERGDERGDESADVKARDEMCDEHERDGVEEPVEEKTKHGEVLSRLVRCGAISENAKCRRWSPRSFYEVI